MNLRSDSAISVIVILALWVSLPFGVSAQSSEEVLMTIGGTPVEKDELVYLLSKGKSNDNSTPGVSREEFEENLELFVNYKLKVKEAEELGLDKTEEFNREFSSFKETLIAPFLIKNSLEEGELRKTYARMQEVIRASHILFQFPPNASAEDSMIVLRMALKVKSEIENGGNINELALQYSDDPSAKTNRGDLGFFTSLQMVQPFEDAVYNLQSGQVSDPVLTTFGYHIIQVRERQPNPGQVRVSHILVRFDPEDQAQELNARRKISDIYNEIQKESTIWEEIVKNYSEDPGTKENGGLLPWFGVGSMIPEFEMAAFSLTETGEVSPPLKTQYGYHILRLEGKRPLEPFEVLEDNIRSRILRDSRSGMIQSQVVAIQKARYLFQENEESLNALSKELLGATKTEFRDRIQAKNWSAQPLFTVKGSSFSIGDFLNYVLDQEVTPRGSGSAFELWYDKFVAYTLAQVEENDLESNNREYQMLLKEYRDGILLFSLMNQEVWQKGITDSLGQVEHYRKNLDQYQWKNRTEAYLVQVLDSTKLQEASSFLQGNGYNPTLIENFESQLKTKYPLAFQTENGVFEYESHPILSQINLEQSFQNVTLDGKNYLIVLGQKIPAGARKFEESRGLIIRDYQDFLDQNLLKRLKEKYKVQINPKIKEEAFLSLNN
jgi:peptidyl-prolyl cis-trans isomerase SurA